ncbi:MAG: glycosyltransferase family 4 protein [Bacteroidales bacterium]|nr:glycosyltransferase family 4 protein [Bacteroidales bacterium]
MEKEIIKKICFVQPRAYYLFNKDIKAPDKVGGAQKQHYLQSIELAKYQEFDVHFLVADFGQKEIEIHQKVTLWKSFNFKDNIFKRVIDLLKVLKKIDAAIYIFRSADAGVAFAILYINYVLRKKVLYQISSDSECSNKELKNKSGYLTAILMSFAYKKADILTAQSENQKKQFEQNRKITIQEIIRNIIEIPEKINRTEESILWIGRLDKVKYPELFLDLAKQYPHEQFVMIAPVVQDDISYGNKIKKKIEKISNIQHFEYVKPNEINHYYQKAKIYVITSYKEGFSNTMTEAMANACPVLSFNVNPDDVFTKHQAGYFAEGSEKLFFKLIDDFLINKNINKSVENASAYLKKYHNKNAIITSLIKQIK